MNMMRIKEIQWIILAAATLSLGACSYDSEQPVPAQEEVELRFSSSLELLTRAAYTKTQDTQIADGEIVYAWVDEAKSSGAVEYIQAWKLTADGNGNFPADKKVKKLYPVSGNPIDVYAIHGNFATTPSGTFPTSAITHNVNTDQSTEANYAVSDLLYATGANLKRQTAAHLLTFSHLLSKIEVYLVAGTGTEDSELATATVSIMNTKPTASVTLSKTAAPTIAVSGSATEIAAKMQHETDVNVTIGSDGTPSPARAFAEAIIVPQWVSSTGASGGDEVDFVKITIGTSSYTAKVSKEFTAGNRYTYNVVVNKSGIELTSTITPWADGGTEVISAK